LGGKLNVPKLETECLDQSAKGLSIQIIEEFKSPAAKLPTWRQSDSLVSTCGAVTTPVGSRLCVGGMRRSLAVPLLHIAGTSGIAARMVA